MTEPACQQLVAFYNELREGDGRNTSQSSYRITVRQLESMIRLSEALARLHLDPDVSPTHVRVRTECYLLPLKYLRSVLKEAHRLMKALVIPVQQEPVILEFDGDDGPGGYAFY